MTWPRMWKCNVYTFNHVLSHRPLPPSSNSQLRMSILSPRLSFPPPPLRYNDINVRPGCVLYPYPPSWHGPQTWRVLRFRGGRGRGTTVLLLEEWNPLKWMRGGFWRWRCRWMLGLGNLSSAASERRTCKFRTGYASIFTSGMTR